MLITFTPYVNDCRLENIELYLRNVEGYLLVLKQEGLTIDWIYSWKQYIQSEEGMNLLIGKIDPFTATKEKMITVLEIAIIDLKKRIIEEEIRNL
jgi:hypothetical protein